MTKMVHLKAAEGSSYLEFSHPIPSANADYIEYFDVTYKAEDLEAAVGVWAYPDAQWLVAIFQDMENSWRGWKDVKEWKAVEEQFSIKFTTDKLGHVFVEVQLQPDFVPGGRWEVKGGFYFEVGQLPTLARQVAEFFSV